MFSPVYTNRVLEPAYQNWKALYASDAVAVHKAHLLGLVERGIVPLEKGRLIARAIDAMASGFSYPATIPPAVEDLYFVYERELGVRIGDENAAYLHTARSRNDMDTTVFRMALRRALLGLAQLVLGTLESVVKRAESSAGELTVLYTHGQPANVSTMGHYLSAFAGELAEDLTGLVAAIDVVNRSTMGACAITGTGFPLDRKRVADLLGFPSFVVNTYTAISTSHWLTRPAAAVEELLQDAGRLMADMLHKASCEVGLLTFPDQLVQISSIMPQKRNPVILEHARIQAGMAVGRCAAIRNLYRNVPYQDVNEAADAPVSELLETLDLAASAITLVREVIENVGSDEAAVLRIASAWGVTSTELADTMVRETGIGFRSAHEVSSRFTRSGNDIAVLRKTYLEVVGVPLPFDDARIRAILEPAHFVEIRRTPGGPSAEGMVPVFGEIAASIRGARGQLEAIGNGITDAELDLDRVWKELTA
jgi:argininosuccinate lyase